MASRILSTRVLCSLLLLLVLTTTAMILMPAGAEAEHTRCGYYFYYYSDATYTNLVGIRFYECDCRLTSWGTITFYRQLEWQGCH